MRVDGREVTVTEVLPIVSAELPRALSPTRV